MKVRKHKLAFLLAMILVLGLGLGVALQAQPAAQSPGKTLSVPGMTVQVDSGPLTFFALMSLLAFVPAVLISMTPFVRLLVVFHFLRQALGTQATPSNQTLIGLTVLLTFFLMQPVGVTVNEVAFTPFQQGQITAFQAIDRGSVPLRDFMLKFTREKDLALFMSIAQLPAPNSPEDLPMRVIMPAYILSELKIAFQIGAVLFLPFLVIDMVVASITTSVGMFQLPPVVISTPLKIFLFVIVDGWNLVVGSLLKSFV